MTLSASYCSNLVVDLRPASRAGIYLPVLGMCMLLSVSLSGIELILKITLLLALAGWMQSAWKLRPGRIQTVVWQAGGDWRLQRRSGDWIGARLLHAFSAGPSLTVLSWRDESGARQLALVTPSVASEASRRRLSCHLHWRPKSS